jgi:hypothetical protein
MNDARMPQNPLLQSALRYASWGWHVLPVVPDSKLPACQHGVNDATTNPEQIRKWWEASPNCNIGIAAGRKSGIVVFDIDPRNGGNDSWLDWCIEHGEPPEGQQQLTAGGGQHFIANYIDGLKSCKLGAGIDVLSDGRYFLASPSSIDGKHYEWEVSSDPADGARPFEIPLAWIAGMQTIVKHRIERAKTELIKGNRNEGLTSVGGSMRSIGLNEDEILHALRLMNETRCEIPLPDSEIKQIARSVARYEIDSNVVVAAALGAQGAADLLNASRDFFFTPANTFLSQPNPIGWTIKGWLPDGSISMVYGESGVGKTFITLDMACCIAAGIDWQGHRVKRGVVVYLCGEGNYGFRQRVAAWANRYGRSDLENLIVSSRAIDLKKNADVHIISAIREVTQLQVSAVFIDTLNNHMEGDENSAKDTRILINSCKDLVAELGCSVCLNHHVGHSREAGQRARGSSAWKASLDSSILVSKTANDLVEIVNTKMKDARLSEPIYGRLDEVDLGWIDEDGNAMTSAVFALTDERPVEAKREKAIDKHIRLFSNAWIASGGELLNDMPYVSKSFLLDYLVQNGISESTAKQYVKPAASGKMMSELVLAEIVQPGGGGFVVKNEVVASQLMLLVTR